MPNPQAYSRVAQMAPGFALTYMKKSVLMIILMIAGTAGFAQTHNTVPGTPLYALDIIWDELDPRYRYRTFIVNDGWGGFPAYKIRNDTAPYKGYVLIKKGEVSMPNRPFEQEIVILDGDGGIDAGLIILGWEDGILYWLQYGSHVLNVPGDWSR
ncbi:hypothetical protein AGMMS49944_10730 [Spirochaetia bacterium]|nr:hypothetical protein AGMMS49944_10730 [Spirochaetia bacterium]